MRLWRRPQDTEPRARLPSSHSLASLSSLSTHSFAYLPRDPLFSFTSPFSSPSSAPHSPSCHSMLLVFSFLLFFLASHLVPSFSASFSFPFLPLFSFFHRLFFPLFIFFLVPCHVFTTCIRLYF